MNSLIEIAINVVGRFFALFISKCFMSLVYSLNDAEVTTQIIPNISRPSSQMQYIQQL